MAFSLQRLPQESKWSHELRLGVLEQCYPRELVAQLLTRCHAWEERERSLSQLLIVYYVIALHLFRGLNLRAVLCHLVRGLRWLWPDASLSLPYASALVYRRQQLGVPVLRHLFRQVCRPLASQETKGAFRFGLRLMAADSTLDDVPDTPANARHFGRLSSGPSQSPFPQVRCLYLAEVGTHAIVDAVFAPCHVGELTLAPVLLARSVGPGMLVMSDRGITCVDFLAAVRAQGAEALGRLKCDVFPKVEQVLPDGSYLTTLHPKGQAPLRVRVIEYRIEPSLAERLGQFPASRSSDQADPTHLHRLVTTLLDPVQAPAQELIACYHERWEIELCIDEHKTHQRLSAQTLRSKDPALVLQELYGPLLAHYAVRSWMHQSALQGD